MSVIIPVKRASEIFADSVLISRRKDNHYPIMLVTMTANINKKQNEIIEIIPNIK